MSAPHHDMVLAITSHLPHLIAYNIVNTAEHLERVTEKEVIKFSAGGFRDFTRIAASDPTMWRDVFLNNKEAVMEMLRRFSDDLLELRSAIESADGDTLFRRFAEARAHSPWHHRRRSGHVGAGLRPHGRRAGRCSGERKRHAQIAMADTHDLWIFAYGSLMWRPGFAAEEVVHARLVGWRRSFCIYSRFHRGSARRPGLVLGLDRGGVCEGHRFSRFRRQRARDAALSARARAGGERLSRSAGAGDAALRRAARR